MKSREETVEVGRDELRDILFNLLWKSSPSMTWVGYMSGMELLLSLDRETAIETLGWLYGHPDNGAQQVEDVARELGIDLAEIRIANDLPDEVTRPSSTASNWRNSATSTATHGKWEPFSEIGTADEGPSARP